MKDIENAEEHPAYDDEIDWRRVFSILWEGKLWIGGFTFAATIIALIIAIMLPNIYRAEALLAPSEDDGMGRLAGLAGQYGGLASLAGIELGGGSSDKAALGLQVLQSRKFLSEFIERRDILVPLIAAKGWDAETGQLEVDPDDYDVKDNKWVRSVRPPKKTIPSLQEAYEEFRDILTVSQDRKSGFVTVSIEHYSPELARQWVEFLVADINQTIMKRDVDEAEEAISYLTKQIQSTSLADLQKVFFKLIEEQTKTVMLAKVSDEYLLKTIDPAIAPEKKTKPKRSLIVIFGMLFGLFFATVVISLIGRLDRS